MVPVLQLAPCSCSGSDAAALTRARARVFKGLHALQLPRSPPCSAVPEWVLSKYFLPLGVSWLRTQVGEHTRATAMRCSRRAPASITGSGIPGRNILARVTTKRQHADMLSGRSVERRAAWSWRGGAAAAVCVREQNFRQAPRPAATTPASKIPEWNGGKFRPRPRSDSRS